MCIPLNLIIWLQNFFFQKNSITRLKILIFEYKIYCLKLLNQAICESFLFIKILSNIKQFINFLKTNIYKFFKSNILNLHTPKYFSF